MVIDRTCRGSWSERRPLVPPILSAGCRTQQPICRCFASRVRRNAHGRVARCCSRCQDATRSRAIQRRKNRNRDDHRNIARLAPMWPTLRSTAAPLPRQVSLHSWFNLLEVAFNCLVWVLSLDGAVYSFGSFTGFCAAGRNKFSREKTWRCCALSSNDQFLFGDMNYLLSSTRKVAIGDARDLFPGGPQSLLMKTLSGM
jgi:hypothetical protein